MVAVAFSAQLISCRAYASSRFFEALTHRRSATMTFGTIQRLCQFLTCALNELIAVIEPDVVNEYRHSAVIRSQIATTMRHRKGITEHLWHRLSDVEKTEFVRRLYDLVSLLNSHAASMQRERLLERVHVEFQLSVNEVFIKDIVLAQTMALIVWCLLDLSGGPGDDEVYAMMMLMMLDVVDHLVEGLAILRNAIAPGPR